LGISIEISFSTFGFLLQQVLDAMIIAESSHFQYRLLIVVSEAQALFVLGFRSKS
jgi:hypothetical protein